mgnify:CR=1 FL=1
MTKLDYKKNTQPHYYIGGIHGYSAKDIVDDFKLNPWTAQAVQYILRAGKKDGSPTEEDIRKAINVLQFELDRLHKENKIKTGAIAK